MNANKKINVKKVFRHTHDPIWQLQLGVVAIIILQIFTDNTFLPYNKFIIVLFEAILLVALAIVTSDGYHRVSKRRKTFALSLIGIVAVINTFSLIFLVRALLFNHTTILTGEAILMSSLTIYATNIFVFALWYWEMDGGGPDKRTAGEKRRDFIFPQMIHQHISPASWLPGFIDYLYLSATNVTNFASADTSPVSHRSKILMMIQALTSVILVVLVVARTIGILQ